MHVHIHTLLALPTFSEEVKDDHFVSEFRFQTYPVEKPTEHELHDGRQNSDHHLIHATRRLERRAVEHVEEKEHRHGL
jgi:hypothetical protein